MNKLPIEIVEIISNNFNNFIDMYSFKLVCKDYNQCINKFLLIKIKLSEKLLLQNKKKINNCVNDRCFYDTKEIFVDYYREYEGNYRHYHQPAMNYDSIFINNYHCKVFSPYCCECFKQNILIKDISKNKISQHYCEGFIDIHYL
jgi:hypothetical protein